MHFLAQPRKNKKNPSRKKLPIFQEMKTDPPLSFSYISRNRNHEEISCISGNGRPEKIPFILRSNFPSAKKTPRKRNSLYFTKWNFLALILKKLLYFLIFQETNYIFRNPWNRTFFYIAGATSNPPKTKIYFIFPKKLWINFSKNTSG